MPSAVSIFLALLTLLPLLNCTTLLYSTLPYPAHDSLITATASFLTSPSAKLSGQAIGNSAVAVADGAKALRRAWLAAAEVVAADAAKVDKADQDGNSSGDSSGSGASSVQNLVARARSVIDSDAVKAALASVGSSLQLSAVEASKAADIAADQLSTSLNNSDKFRNALQSLTDSLVTLLAILGVAVPRFAKDIQQEISKQLPSDKSV